MSISTQCLKCKYYIAFSTCEAYPDKIPQEIFNGMVDHTESYSGDNGIIFEPLEYPRIRKMVKINLTNLAKVLRKERVPVHRKTGTFMEYRRKGKEAEEGKPTKGSDDSSIQSTLFGEKIKGTETKKEPKESKFFSTKKTKTMAETIAEMHRQEDERDKKHEGEKPITQFIKPKEKKPPKRIDTKNIKKGMIIRHEDERRYWRVSKVKPVCLQLLPHPTLPSDAPITARKDSLTYYTED